MAITPTGAVLAELEPEQVTVVDLDGRHVDGELAPTSEVELHLGVYRRYDAGAVVHTHSPMATALSCVLDEVPVRALRDAPARRPGAGRAVRRRSARPSWPPRCSTRSRAGRAALMANHGAIVHAGDAAEALELALLLEWACTVYWRAAAIGEPRALGEERAPGGDRGGRSRAATARRAGWTRTR